jgi:L-threonylcarbamoyladenylate synthase
MPAARLSASTQDLERAAELLRQGDLVAFPTETVYGLGADARQDHAVARILRPSRRWYIGTITPMPSRRRIGPAR